MTNTRSRAPRHPTRRPEECVLCGEVREVHFRTRRSRQPVCSECFHAELYLPPRRECQGCGSVRVISGQGLCSSCWRERHEEKCGWCGRKAGVQLRVGAKPACKRCYRGRFEPLQKAECANCGKKKRIYFQGVLCLRCGRRAVPQGQQISALLVGLSRPAA